MHDVDAMIENVPEPAARHGHPGELAVDGVEQRHHPAAGEADRIRALIERVRRREHEQDSEQRDAVRRDAEARAPADQHSRRSGPPPFGDEIGDALVGVAVEQRLERGALVRRHRLEQRRRGLAQVAIVAGEIEHREHAQVGRPGGAVADAGDDGVHVFARHRRGRDATVVRPDQQRVRVREDPAQREQPEQEAGIDDQDLLRITEIRRIRRDRPDADFPQLAAQALVRIEPPQTAGRGSDDERGRACWRTLALCTHWSTFALRAPGAIR